MNNMGGKILESFSEKERRAGEKGIVSAVKDIRNGVKTSELKKKYSEETIKRAKTIA